MRKNPAPIAIDFPRPNEQVRPPHYSFRVRTQVAGVPEVSLDNGPWQACRESVGLWWFDWIPAPGNHRLVARVKSSEGRVHNTTRRSFKVPGFPSNDKDLRRRASARGRNGKGRKPRPA